MPSGIIGTNYTTGSPFVLPIVTSYAYGHNRTKSLPELVTRDENGYLQIVRNSSRFVSKEIARANESHSK